MSAGRAVGNPAEERDPAERRNRPRLLTETIVVAALAYAVDYAGDEPSQDVHVLLGLLTVSNSLATHILSELGVSLRAVERIVREQR
jgi:hypothetical protein